MGWKAELVSDAPTPAAVTETAAIPTPGATPGATSAAANTNSKNTELSKVADKFTSVATPGSADYKIGPQDVLDISVFKVPELSRSVQVADAGTINLPLVGEVTATGKTAREIERDLATKLGAKYLQSPQVTVYIKEYNSQRVTLDGAVKKPGVYPIRGKTTLMQAVALAEGLTDVADSSCIVVFRRTGDKRTAARFDLGEIRAGRAEDPALRAGDVIVADELAGKVAFQTVLKALPLASVVPLL